MMRIEYESLIDVMADFGEYRLSPISYHDYAFTFMMNVTFIDVDAPFSIVAVIGGKHDDINAIDLDLVSTMSLEDLHKTGILKELTIKNSRTNTIIVDLHDEEGLE